MPARAGGERFWNFHSGRPCPPENIFAPLMPARAGGERNPFCLAQAGEGKTVQRRGVRLISCSISSKIANPNSRRKSLYLHGGIFVQSFVWCYYERTDRLVAQWHHTFSFVFQYPPCALFRRPLFATCSRARIEVASPLGENFSSLRVHSECLSVVFGKVSQNHWWGLELPEIAIWFIDRSKGQNLLQFYFWPWQSDLILW
jgi:hypothetical protein